jgi:retinol dehydrogenase 14
MLTPEEGGRALTYLAVSPDVERVTGEYFDRFEPRPPSELAQDDKLGLRLREESARLVGLPVS